ncbi:LacI family DNA-binding transcriptional regulator [Tepidimicrobium xylanilyticum]|uniref:Transcriptional regulator, LacI family n=1 Tax=Tepidimicrobium xylanilyticum TaxID=1123352 RepID=A0A1H3A967_9FIRM|nr:LacI family DNA-binding transcriptional regulator [Tepidimicrobium xylanilyticum]GMG96281.1 LacI family transcriptional regulator [Tepidimicrobium xylanilyticum]SDX26115.1 transcriptional regulator, LacI family [Tepidimicrobium xylanilyticum]
MSVTIKDVAKLANVSISTVSRVINNSKPVSLEARKRVLDAIEQLGYKPNEVARSLVTRKSNLIGVIVTDIGNSYIAEMIRGIEEIGRMYKYDIVLSSSYGNPDTEKKFAQLLMSKQVEGIILVSENDKQSVIEEIKGLKIPFVYLNRYYDSQDMPTVTINNFEASQEMTKYLVNLGHRNILYVTSNEDNKASLERFKIDGYKKAISDVDKAEEFIYSVKGFKPEDGYKMGDKVMEIVKENNITAVFCCQDELAIGFINYCYDNGIKVPEDISVSGYGDTKMASIYRPRLTTVKEPYYDIGAVAIRRIIKNLKSEEKEKDHIYLPIRIMKRESCKKI